MLPNEQARIEIAGTLTFAVLEELGITNFLQVRALLDSIAERIHFGEYRQGAETFVPFEKDGQRVYFPDMHSWLYILSAREEHYVAQRSTKTRPTDWAQ